MVLLTSFDKSKQLIDVTCFSVSKWQPSGFNYLEAYFFAPLAADERELRSSIYFRYDRDGLPRVDEAAYVKGLRVYRERYLASLLHRKREIAYWLSGLKKLACPDAALCSWCPDTRSAQLQIKAFGCFACHTGLIGQFLAEHFAVQIALDQERAAMLVAEWRP